MDPCSLTFLIALANKLAVESTLIFSLWRFNGMVSVTISSVNADFSMVSQASPESTGWVHTARTLAAPFSMMSDAALDNVRAVSQMSSINTISWPVTSPMIDIDSISLARFRCLSQITTSALKYLANVRARYDPPISGDAMVRFGRLSDLMWGTKITEASKWSTGISKKPWIWAAWRSMVIKRCAPAAVMRLAIILAPIATRGLSLRS